MSDKQPCNVKIRVAAGSQSSELPPSRDLTADIEGTARIPNCWIAAPVRSAESGARGTLRSFAVPAFFDDGVVAVETAPDSAPDFRALLRR